MKRFAFFLYGLAAHALFLVVFLYLMAFVGGLVVRPTIDRPAATPWLPALVIDLLLLGAFAVPHSVMARPAFKRWWTQFVPPPLERSTYVMISNLLMILLLWQWRPLPAVVWNVQTPVLCAALWAVFVTGWLLVPAASLLINHFDLFGTRQVWLHLRGRAYTHLPFRTPLLYRRVRHPLYLGWMTAFWAIPTMTLGHLLFAAVLSAYMLIAIGFEERDLTKVYGQTYAEYRRRVPMLIPRPGAGVKGGTDVLDTSPATA